MKLQNMTPKGWSMKEKKRCWILLKLNLLLSERQLIETKADHRLEKKVFANYVCDRWLQDIQRTFKA